MDVKNIKNVNKDISNERKKRFIVENYNILNKDTKLMILNIIMMEIGTSVIMETNNKKDFKFRTSAP